MRRCGRLSTLGVASVLHDGDLNHYFLQLLNGILEKASHHGQNVTVFTLEDWRDDVSRLAGFCDGRIDGMILIAPIFDAQSAAADPSDRIPIPQKVSYGLGTFLDMWGQWLYNSLAFQVFNIFLHMNPVLVSTVLMINRMWDAVTDPVFGWLSDNTRTRWGRRRPYILVAGVLAGLCMPLLYAVGRDWSTHHYFIFMILSSAVYICITSAFMMPWNSLGLEMPPCYHERTIVMGVRNAIQKAPELAMFFAGQFTTLAIWDGANFDNLSGRLYQLFTTKEAWAHGRGENILLGAQVYATFLGLIMVVCAVVMFFALRERYYKNVVARHQKNVRILETIYKAIGCKPFRYLLFMVLAYGLGTSMVGALGYYNTIYYVCGGDVGLGAVWDFKMGIAGMIFGFSGIPFYTRISGKVGKRREGAFSACQSWIMKFGMALGAGASGWILAATGFDADLGGDQSERAIFYIRFMLSTIPVIFLIGALFALYRFPLTKEKMASLRVDLENMRGKV